MKPKLSSESLDLMLEVIEAMEDDNAFLVTRLVESAFVDGASWTVANIKGDVTGPVNQTTPTDGEKIEPAAGSGFGRLWLDVLKTFRLVRRPAS
jgi:hypothetical protein